MRTRVRAAKAHLSTFGIASASIIALTIIPHHLLQPFGDTSGLHIGYLMVYKYSLDVYRDSVTAISKTTFVSGRKPDSSFLFPDVTAQWCG